MPQHDQDTAVEDGIAGAEDAIGQPAADDAGHIDERAIDRHDGESRCLIDPKTALGGFIIHIVNEDCPHPVIGETLPELCEEQCKQSFRMTEETLLRDTGDDPFSVYLRHV